MIAACANVHIQTAQLVAKECMADFVELHNLAHAQMGAKAVRILRDDAMNPGQMSDRDALFLANEIRSHPGSESAYTHMSIDLVNRIDPKGVAGAHLITLSNVSDIRRDANLMDSATPPRYRQSNTNKSQG